MSGERQKLVIIVDESKKMFHFTSTHLVGVCNEAWYPYAEGKLFEYVERYLTSAKVANNVTLIEPLRSCGINKDYKVTYNPRNESRLIINGVNKKGEISSIITFSESLDEGYKQFWEGIENKDDFDLNQQLSTQFLDPLLKQIA